MTGNGDHFPVQHVTTVTGTVGSKYDSLSPPTATTLQLPEPSQFSAEPQLTFCLGSPRRSFSLCLILRVHFTQEDSSSHVKLPSSSFQFLSKNHPLSTSGSLSGKLKHSGGLLLPMHMSDALTFYASVNEWGRNA